MKSINFETSVELLGNVRIPVPGQHSTSHAAGQPGQAHISPPPPPPPPPFPPSPPSPPTLPFPPLHSLILFLLLSCFQGQTDSSPYSQRQCPYITFRKGIFICTVFVLSCQECNGCLWFKTDTIHRDCVSHGPGLS